MPLKSTHFTRPQRIQRLEDCLIHDHWHIKLKIPYEKGLHVSKIQEALFLLMNDVNLGDELGSEIYGPQTAAAVQRYKETHRPPIINTAYQSRADNIVGKMTIQWLDEDMANRSAPAPAPPKPTPPDLTIPKEWFVTSLSLSSLAVVLGLGFTAAVGSIKFEKPNGTSKTLSIGMVGPTLGLSLVPDIGKLLGNVSKFAPLFSRFPTIQRILLNDRLLLIWIDTQFKILHALGPRFTKIAEALATGLSGGLTDWWSGAIGLVFGSKGNLVYENDFAGPCICYSVGGAVGPGNFGFLFCSLVSIPISPTFC